MSDPSDRLPVGWRRATLEELAEPKGIAYGVLKPGPPTPAGIPMLRVADVHDGRVDTSSVYRISAKLDGEFKRTKLRGGEVLISIQGSVGRTAVVPSELAGANISRTLAVIRLKDPQLADWVHRALESPQTQAAIRDLIGGTTRDSLNLRDLRMIEIPVAPETTRPLVLDVVNRTLALGRSTTAHVSNAEQTIQGLRRSVLAAAYSGHLTAAVRERMGWPAAADMTIAEVLADGLFIDGDWIESKDQDPHGDVRLIQLADVGDGYFRDRSSRFLTRAKAAELHCTYLKPGDVLVARMPEPLGRACVFPGAKTPAVTAVDVCILRPGPSGPDGRWLLHAINAPQTREAMQSFVRGTTRQRISRRNLGLLPLPVPFVDEQVEVVRRVDEMLQLQTKLGERVAVAARQIERSSQAVLSRAFGGELALNGSNRAGAPSHDLDTSA